MIGNEKYNEMNRRMEKSVEENGRFVANNTKWYKIIVISNCVINNIFTILFLFLKRILFCLKNTK